MPDVAVGLALFAGLAAAYVQAIAGYWLEGVPGLPRIDVAEAGKRYLAGERPGWWAVGMLAHLANGALLGLLYASVVYPSVAGGRALPGRLAAGAGFGVVVWVFVLGLIVLPLAGAGLFGLRGRPPHYGRATLLLHVLYGLTLGAIYRPA